MLVKINEDRWLDARYIQALTVEGYEFPDTHGQLVYYILICGTDYEGKSFEGTLSKQYDSIYTARNEMDEFAENLNKEREQ